MQRAGRSEREITLSATARRPTFSSQPAESQLPQTRRDGNGKPGGADFRAYGREPRPLEELESEARTPDALAGERNRGRLEVGARGVKVGCVPQAELDVDGRGDPDQLGNLVQADEAAERVGSLNVEVDRKVGHGADRRDLRERQVGWEIQCRSAELVEQ